MPSPVSSPDLGLGSLAAFVAVSVPDWAIWKGAERLDDAGDLDSVAPERSWDAVADAVLEWLGTRGAIWLVTCRHVPGQLVLVGCGGSLQERLLQVDVVDRKLVHGAPVWTADDLLAVTAATGVVRSVRPGAEGVARVLADRSDVDGAALARDDPDGAARLEDRLGFRARVARRRGPVGRALTEATLAARAAMRPVSVARSARTDRARRGCPVLAALRAGRRAPGDVTAWVELVAVDHEVRHA